MDQPIGPFTWGLPPPRLAVVDTDPTVQRQVAELAVQVGFKVTAHGSGKDFRDRWSDATAPDLLVMDGSVRDPETIEIFRHLHVTGYSGAVLVLTADDARQMRSTVRLGRLLGLTILASLAKPIDAVALRGLLLRQSSRCLPISVEEVGDGIDAGEILVDFLPISDVVSGTVRGFEALARWNSPLRGLIAPEGFIPLIDDTMVLSKLSDVVLAKAMVSCASWRAAGFDLDISVNVGARCLMDHLFPEKIVALTERHRVPPSRLTLEISEQAAMSDPEGIVETLLALDRRGVRLAIDDFGTGYTSIPQLARLPFSEMKIDRGFMGDGVEARTIARCAIALGRSLGFTVVAEGVETRAAMDLARAEGCAFVQGHFVSRALGAGEVLPWLDHRSATN